MELYITIYILLGISILLVFTKLRKIEYLVLLLWCIFFTFFGGLRWYTGGDFQQGIDIFNQATWSNFYNFTPVGKHYSVEPLYVLFHLIVRLFTDEYYFVMLLICCFNQFTYYRMCRFFSPDHPLILYALLIIGLRSIFPVRADFAMAFIYWAYYFLCKNKVGMFVLFALIATGIHMMSLMLFFVALVYFTGFKIKPWLATLLFVSFIVAGAMFRDYFVVLAGLLSGDIADKILTYSQYETTESLGGIPIVTIILNGFYLFIFFYNRKICYLGNNTWYNTLLMSSVLVMGINFVFREGMSDLTRLLAPLGPSLLILQARTYNYYWNKSSYKIIARLLFVVIVVKNVLGFLNSNSFLEDALPYVSIFD